MPATSWLIRQFARAAQDYAELPYWLKTREPQVQNTLNDYMRSSADRLNIPLETSSGPLSMADLSRVYRALLQDRK